MIWLQDDMKKVLVEKFEDEGCCFTVDDIIIKKKQEPDKDIYNIAIKDYESIPFVLTMEHDDYFGKCVYIYDTMYDETIIFEASKQDYKVESVLKQLGYYIANTF